VDGHCNFGDPGDIPPGAFRGAGLGLASEAAEERAIRHHRAGAGACRGRVETSS
jgi:hypothetical protein